jgi:hypothetical protein
MDRRQQLIEAGMVVFAEKGYHRTKVSDVVCRAGVAQGTFYFWLARNVADDRDTWPTSWPALNCWATPGVELVLTGEEVYP